MASIIALLVLFFNPLRLETPNAGCDMERRMYVWHVDGITLYQAPSLTSRSMGYLAYGDELTGATVLNKGPVPVKIYENAEAAEMGDAYFAAYTLPARWIELERDGVKLYVLDAYLSYFPPPGGLDSYYFDMQQYAAGLSPVISEKNEGQTESFCSRTTLHLQNGITYTFTDFGPCEQCGHGQELLYLPLVSKTEGLMMALHFLKCAGLFTEESTILLRQNGKDMEIDASTEYGQTSVIRVVEQENGILFIDDIYL